MARYTVIILLFVTFFFITRGHANVFIDDIPITFFTDLSSKLDHPEGCAFSPSGDYIAVANLFSNSVTFYKQIDGDGTLYEQTPKFSIKGKRSKLCGPHDLAFSPDGNYIAIANRKSHSITIHKKNISTNTYNISPITEIKGENSQIQEPNSVRYSPLGHTLAVVNASSNTITFYHYEGDFYEQTPYQIIKESQDVLWRPNGLDFSSDGELLAVTSRKTHALLIYQRLSSLENNYTEHPIQILQGPETNLIDAHSVCFHPYSNYLIASNSWGVNNINIFKPISSSSPYYEIKPIITLDINKMYDKSTMHLIETFPEGEGGCKGVTFSPDGKKIAVTQNLSTDLPGIKTSVGVLLIYPITIDN